MPTSTDSITVLLPQITAASVSPNPASINAKATLTVTVTESVITLEPYYYYAGEIYAGEVT